MNMSLQHVTPYDFVNFQLTESCYVKAVYCRLRGIHLGVGGLDPLKMCVFLPLKYHIRSFKTVVG